MCTSSDPDAAAAVREKRDVQMNERVQRASPVQSAQSDARSKRTWSGLWSSVEPMDQLKRVCTIGSMFGFWKRLVCGW